MYSPGSLDWILGVDIHACLRVELYVVVEPLGEVRGGTVLARHNYFHLFVVRDEKI